MLPRLKHISALLVGLVTISVLALQHFAIKTEKDFMLKAYVVDISDTLKAHQKGKDRSPQETGNCQRFERFYLFIVRSIYQVYDKYTVEPGYFEVPREMEKKFEIEGLRNNRGSVKGKGKSKGLRSSFEIAGTSN